MDSLEIAARTDAGKITLIEFIPGVFRFLRILPGFIKAFKSVRKLKPGYRESMGTHIEANAVNFANNTALVFEKEKYTYREFNEQANRIANFFLSQGTKRGDVVVVLLDNRPELLFCIAGLGKIGAIASLINPNLRGAVLEHCVSIEPASAYIIDEELVDAFEEIRPNISVDPTSTIYFSTNGGKTPAPERYVDLFLTIPKI